VCQAFSVRTWRCPAGILAVGLALAGCGGAQPKSVAPGPAQQAVAFKGSPAVLASLHHQADQLLGGGTAAFRTRLRSLRGHPVVVNKWASWCGPCRIEFPAFQRASVRYGRQVAFIGIDGKDANSSAKTFLRQFPVSYPSYTDPGSNIANSIQAAIYFPQTVYFNRAGQMVYDHAGPYESAQALESDIRRYALG
jgi:cytochrome c biogenesis protein CcmG/thiol:disulfide interchange protein DsbE